jgi:hypothetical protein
MLSTDRSMTRADHRPRRAALRTSGSPAREPAECLDPCAPWDDRLAEVLTSLYESEEGRLWRPATGDRARPSSFAQASQNAGDGQSSPEAVDRRWLEAHLSGLAERLQDILAEANPKPAFAALNGRLETIEQRFGATLGRVAQRADLEGLRSIESRVQELTGQMEQARERLERISSVDDEVRALAGKVEEAGAQRTSGLERLLRDCIAEWREGEQRTAAALQSIEEAVTRLGEAVDAMEASKPALDLTVPALPGMEPVRAAPAMNGSLLHAGGDVASLSTPYHAMLDAADYAPAPLTAELSAASAPSSAGREPPAEDHAGWSGASDGERERLSRAKLTPGALRIMALRAKLRQSNGSGRGGLPYLSAAAMGAQRQGALRRASLSMLLMAGAAILAGSTYFLLQTLVATAPGAGPGVMAPGAAPAGALYNIDPHGRRPQGKGAS